MSTTVAACHAGAWKPHNLEDIFCTEGISIIAAGFPRVKAVEAYGPEMHRMMSLLPYASLGHSLNYVEGKVS